MSHLNRAVSGTGGGPPALSTPLLNNGLQSSRPGRPSLSAENITSIIGNNTIISNVDYHEKLQTLQTIFSRPISTPTASLVLYLVSPTANPNKIRSDLDARYGFKSLSYIPESSVSGLDYSWFRDLRNGLAIVPIQDMLLALDRGLIDLSVPSHLVLDDAHSIVLDGLSAPLGTFLLEYYGKLVSSKRPRILGFTRYPLEQKNNFGYLALRMEQLLDARVLGDLRVRRQEVTAEVARLPVSVLEYPPPHSQGASSSILGEEGHPAFRSTLDELGESCGAVLQQLPLDWDIQGIIRCKPFTEINSPGPNIGTSRKFEVLSNYLRTASQTPDFRCIIIASNPFTVLALGWLLSSNQQAELQVSIYLEHLQMNHGYSDRETLLDSFLTGSINTLICDDTVLAEMDDGISSHVIWFNPYSSLIALAQSRRLARHSNASLILLAEQNNREYYSAARDVLRMEPVVTNWVMGMNVDGAPIPPPSIALCPRFGVPVIIGISKKSTPEASYIVDPFSGARIYSKDSEEVLYRFLATQSNSHYAVLPVKLFSYTTSAGEGLWRCIINVSSCNPPLNVSGEPSSSKAIARGSACLRACATLFNLGSLPSTLFPLRPMNFWNHGILQRSTDSPASKGDYPLVFPLFWHNCLLAAPSKVFHPTVINFAAVSGSGTYKSMLVLTRQTLPCVEEFSVFPSQTEFKVTLRQHPSIVLDTEHLELIFRYTIYLWRILTNKPFESPSGELAYFVAPVRGDVNLELNSPEARIVEEFISWDEVNRLVSSRVRPLNCADSNEMSLDLEAGVIQDRSHEFTRRFENGKLRMDLNPLSPVMQEQGSGPHMSILDYYRTHRHEFEGIKDLQQPLIEATLLPGLVNNLDPKEPPVTLTKNYLVPEMCSVSTIPASTFHTASLIPSIIWHIEGALIAKEMNLTFFQGQIREELLMYALCSQAARRTFNYERLEFLGDTFIKYAASTYLYGTEPNATAGLLHTRRQRMVNNRTLCQGAQAVGLPSCIQSEPFRPKFWAIPNANVSRRTQTPVGSIGDQEPVDKVNRRLQPRHIADKVVADVVEAIIGAALLSGGESLGFSAAKTLGFDSPRACDWLDVTAFTPSKPALIREPQDQDVIRGIMKVVGIPLNDHEILLQAIHHPSLTSLSESYERLEFLGDAVLDMLVVQSFFSDEEKWSPHNMTLIKSSMVSNRALAIICVESGLHRYLKHDAPQLTKQIKTFVEEIEKCKRIAKTDSQRLRSWSTLQAPKALGDVVESLLGAIYVSSGFRLSRVKAVYDRLLKPFYDRYIDKKAMLSHPMSQLMAKLESAGCRALGLVKTVLPSTDGNTYVTKCEVKVHGRVIAEAISERPKQAIAQATQEAFEHLEHKPNYLSQSCTCNPVVPGKKRKRIPLEEGEIVDSLAGGDADHPIDFDMFDF